MNPDAKYIVYMHTTPSNKRYIGITMRSIRERYSYGSGYVDSSYFNNAIKKYGWENIKHEVLYEGLSFKEACEKEVELIAEYKTQQREYGYNLTSGGEGHSGVKITEETRAKLRQSHLGHKLSEETRQRQSIAQKKRHAEHPVSEETRRKIGAKHKGKKMSEEAIRKMRFTKQNRTYNMKGLRKLTEKEKQHLSEINKGDKSPRAVKVICLDTLKVYNTIVSASIDTNSNKTGINGVCKGRNYTANKLHWAYYDESKPKEYYEDLLKKKIEEKKASWFGKEHLAKMSENSKKKVVCLETNIIYDSIMDASKKTNVNYASISHCCTGRQKVAGGYHWRYAD